MEDNAASNNSELVDAAGSGDADASAPASDEVAVEQEETDQPPPPMAVVEAPSPINSEAEDEAEDQAAESQPPHDVADVVQPTEENGGVREEEQQEDVEEDRDIEEGDGNGAALLQQLSESLRQQTDLSNEHQSDSQSGRQDASDHRAVADRQLEDHKRELQQLQSELRRELAEEKRQLDERLAGRQQAAAGDSDYDKPPSRLALDNPIHMALNLRPDSSVRPYLPAEMLSSPGRSGAATGHSYGHGQRQHQHRVLPSSLTSEELRLLEDVRQRLSRASVDEQPLPPPPQPRPRHQREQQQPQRRYRVDPAAAAHPDDDKDGMDPLVRSTHERLAGVSDRIRRYQQDTSDYFNQSVLLGCSPTEREDADATAVNGGRYGADHSDDHMAGDFSSHWHRAYQRYNGHSAGPGTAAAPVTSPPSVRGNGEPPPLSLLHQLSPADDVDAFDSDVAAAAASRRRRNHLSASSRGGGERQDSATAAAVAFEKERRQLLCELREAREEASRAAELRDQLEVAHAALREAAMDIAKVHREHHAARAQDRAESERLRAKLTEARAETDRLRRRLAGAESERMFLRNRERGVGSHCLSGDWSEEHLPEHSHLPAGVDSVPVRNDGQRSPTESLRQSLADLERRQLIDTLPQARDSMGGGGGGGGGPAWDRDAQLAEIRTLEQRYDQLQLEKRRVESALNHVPGVGSAKYGRQSREDKDRLEKRLDSIDRELGSLRITLRQYHVIKSAC